MSTVGQAYRGFPGETAGARVLRLSGEHGVPVSVAGEEAAQTRLGIQRPDRYLETLDTITKADLGFLFERRDGRELAYRSRSTLYNQDPVITLNFANGVISEPFQPTDGDKLTKNDVAVDPRGRGHVTAGSPDHRPHVRPGPARRSRPVRRGLHPVPGGRPPDRRARPVAHAPGHPRRSPLHEDHAQPRQPQGLRDDRRHLPGRRRRPHTPHQPPRRPRARRRRPHHPRLQGGDRREELDDHVQLHPRERRGRWGRSRIRYSAGRTPTGPP
ncbi:hypothetical protein SMICM304S_06780 [Streptomyces microflavus]